MTSVLAAACGASEVCDSAALSAALLADDHVRVGDCRITGSFVVPPGVTLEGNGPTSVIVAPATESALVLEGGSGTTTLRNLSVVGAGGIAVLGEELTAVVIEDVSVDSSLGAAIALDTLGAATLSRVQLSGPIAAGSTVRSDLGPDETATHGLVLRQVDSATLTDVTTTGFGRIGVAIVDSDTTWTGGGCSDTLGTGLFVSGGRATLEDLALTRTMEGIGIFAAFAGVFTRGAVVETRNLMVTDNARYGLVHLRAEAHHADATISGNGDVGVWIEASNNVCVDGPGTTFSANSFAAIMVHSSTNVELADAFIGTTSEANHVFPWGFSVVGDGVHAVGDNSGLVLRSLELENNERGGISLELPLGMALPTISGVVVRGMGEQLGAVAGEVTMPMDMAPFLAPTSVEGWDSGIVREGSAQANDEAFVMRGGPATGNHDIAGIITPTMVPATNAIASMGVRSIITPTM